MNDSGTSLSKLQELIRFYMNRFALTKLQAIAAIKKDLNLMKNY